MIIRPSIRSTFYSQMTRVEVYRADKSVDASKSRSYEASSPSSPSSTLSRNCDVYHRRHLSVVRGTFGDFTACPLGKDREDLPTFRQLGQLVML